MKNLLTYGIKVFTNIAHFFNEREPEEIITNVVVTKEDFVLDVPFAEKDKAKFLGARWNPKIKKWYVPKGQEISKFERWVSESDNVSKITLDPPLYLAVSHRISCWKCSQEHRVLCLSDGKTYFSFVKKIPKSVELILKEKFPTYFFDYSKTVNHKYLMNHCSNCMAKSGDFFLHQEEDSPFWPDDYTGSGEIEMIKLDLNPEEKIEIEL